MDLVQTVRKEGSRGGAGDFSWTDVATSSHRENYLGHSIMAPVGRWQRGRDLNWYAKGESDAGNGNAGELNEEQKRREEIRKVKEGEEDEMRKALGLPPIDRSANAEPLGADRKLMGIVNDGLGERKEENPDRKDKGTGTVTGIGDQGRGQDRGIAGQGPTGMIVFAQGMGAVIENGTNEDGQGHGRDQGLVTGIAGADHHADNTDDDADEPRMY